MSNGAEAMADRSEIREVVESVVATLRGDLTAADLTVFKELEDLARFIEEAKHEIASVRPDEIQSKHLPTATDELDAIVGATADATNAILDSVERIEAIAGRDGALRQEVEPHVTCIYEACNFQDITGQRVTKVVRALKEIEAKITALIAALGGKSAPTPIRAPAPAAAAGDERSLLNGPQLKGAGVSQSDIDAMFDRT